MIPAPRFFWVLGAAALLMVAGVADPRLSAAALAVDALLLLAWLVDAVRAGRVRPGAERVWPGMLVQGVDERLTVRLTAGSRCEVELRETLSPALAEHPARERFSLTAGAAREWSIALTPLRRGEHECGALTARILGPWRLAYRQRRLLEPQRRRVYPQVRWSGEVGVLLGLARRRQLGSTPFAQLGAGSEPYALRQYLPGDPLAKIHWKSTARHGHPITREETWERGVGLVVLLDCSRTMAGDDGERSKLDWALAASLALARVAVGRGDRVTVMAFSDRVERLVRVGRSARGVSRAYDALYDVESRLCEPAYDLVAERALAVESRGAAMVLLTSVTDLAAAEMLGEALLQLRRRHRTLLVNLLDPELRRRVDAVPTTPVEAQAQIAGLGIRLANRSLERGLRRAGVRTVSCSADRLALETLGGYLALFGRQVAAGRRALRAVVGR
ncbi:MAG: DUF58 domain-containing protein [Thermoanaerobaculia bacterium]